MLERLKALVGADRVLSGDELTAWDHDWARQYKFNPLAVVRPRTTLEVSKIVTLANACKVPVVPVSGNTGLAGGTVAEGAVMISLDRMNTIREVNKQAHTATLESGVILSRLHDAAEAEGMIFPLTFGARGSAMIGGALSTNAGGSNVLRYGNTRDLCLGIEAVLPTGEVMNLMSALHKDNSGYNLRNLLIGAEGTLGIITAAVVKLYPQPLSYATAMVAVPTLADALHLLNRLQAESGGLVEAFEYMPGTYIRAHQERFPKARAPFETTYDVNILVEMATTVAREAAVDSTGKVPFTARLEEILAQELDQGRALDAVVAQTLAQRREMWARREQVAEVVTARLPIINNDIAIPLASVQDFFSQMDRRLAGVDPGAQSVSVAHLGDGNVHYSVWPSDSDPENHDRIVEAVEDVVCALGGSFSAEHGIGLAKRSSMARRKDPVALAAMRAIKGALDPNNIMNPGKVLPDPQ